MSPEYRLTWPNPLQWKGTEWEASVPGLRPSHNGRPGTNLRLDQPLGMRLVGEPGLISSCFPPPGLARMHLSKTLHFWLHDSLVGNAYTMFRAIFLPLSQPLRGPLACPYFHRAKINYSHFHVLNIIRFCLPEKRL